MIFLFRMMDYLARFSLHWKNYYSALVFLKNHLAFDLFIKIAFMFQIIHYSSYLFQKELFSFYFFLGFLCFALHSFRTRLSFYYTNFDIIYSNKCWNYSNIEDFQTEYLSPFWSYFMEYFSYLNHYWFDLHIILTFLSFFGSEGHRIHSLHTSLLTSQIFMTSLINCFVICSIDLDLRIKVSLYLVVKLKILIPNFSAY